MYGDARTRRGADMPPRRWRLYLNIRWENRVDRLIDRPTRQQAAASSAARRQPTRGRRRQARGSAREGWEERRVQARLEDFEAGRVVLDPVGAGGAEVLV